MAMDWYIKEQSKPPWENEEIAQKIPQQSMSDVCSGILEYKETQETKLEQAYNWANILFVGTFQKGAFIHKHIFSLFWAK